MRIVSLSWVIALCLGAAGCATSVPSLSFNNPPPSDPPPTPEPPRGENKQLAQATGSDQSVLGNIWDNFSSAFSSGAEPHVEKKVIENGGAVQPLDKQRALHLVNAYRKTKGLAPLALDARAEKAAKMIVEDMARTDHMSHTGLKGTDVTARLTLSGYDFRLAAENIGVGQLSADEMIEDWKKSPKHNQNILLPDATHMGIAMQYRKDGKYKTYWALVLAAPS